MTINTIEPHHAEQFQKQGYLYPVNVLSANRLSAHSDATAQAQRGS